MIYGWVWDRLPGRWPVRAAVAVALVLAAVAVLWFVVFPWVEPRLPWSDVTLDG